MRTREDIAMKNESSGLTSKPTLLVRKDGTTSVSWGPANGSRPPFREGNLMALKHGAFSDRMIDVVAAEVGEELQKKVQRRKE